MLYWSDSKEMSRIIFWARVLAQLKIVTGPSSSKWEISRSIFFVSISWLNFGLSTETSERIPEIELFSPSDIFAFTLILAGFW